MSAHSALTLEDLKRVEEAYDPLWRLGLNALAVLVDILEMFRPGRILELGPGYSSVFLYEYAAAQRSDGKRAVEYFAIDEIGEIGLHGERHKEIMNQQGFDTSNIFTVPRVAGTGNYDFSWVHIPDKWKADFILVDGPSGPTGRVTDDSVAFLRGVSSPNTAWLIDDIHRPDGAFLYDMIRRGGRFRAANIPDGTKICGALLPAETMEAHYLQQGLNRSPILDKDGRTIKQTPSL